MNRVTNGKEGYKHLCQAVNLGIQRSWRPGIVASLNLQSANHHWCVITEHAEEMQFASAVLQYWVSSLQRRGVSCLLLHAPCVKEVEAME